MRALNIIIILLFTTFLCHGAFANRLFKCSEVFNTSKLNLFAVTEKDVLRAIAQLQIYVQAHSRESSEHQRVRLAESLLWLTSRIKENPEIKVEYYEILKEEADKKFKLTTQNKKEIEDTKNAVKRENESIRTEIVRMHSQILRSQGKKEFYDYLMHDFIYVDGNAPKNILAFDSSKNSLDFSGGISNQKVIYNSNSLSEISLIKAFKQTHRVLVKSDNIKIVDLVSKLEVPIKLPKNTTSTFEFFISDKESYLAVNTQYFLEGRNMSFRILVFKTSDGTQVAEWDMPGIYRPFITSWTADENKILVVNGGKVWIWDFLNNTRDPVVSGMDTIIDARFVNKDQTIVLDTSAHSVFYDLASKNKSFVSQGQHITSDRMIVSGDSRYFITRSRRGIYSVFDAHEGQRLAMLDTFMYIRSAYIDSARKQITVFASNQQGGGDKLILFDFQGRVIHSIPTIKKSEGLDRMLVGTNNDYFTVSYENEGEMIVEHFRYNNLNDL